MNIFIEDELGCGGESVEKHEFWCLDLDATGVEVIEVDCTNLCPACLAPLKEPPLPWLCCDNSLDHFIHRKCLFTFLSNYLDSAKIKLLSEN